MLIPINMTKLSKSFLGGKKKGKKVTPGTESSSGSDGETTAADSVFYSSSVKTETTEA